MQHAHFKELQDWSERKHELIIKYLKGFVKILGGSTKGIVYYIDGFAGPGIYNDGAKGSPVRAGEYAQTLIGKHYQLNCINVESDQACFLNLQQNTLAYESSTTNHPGSFGDYVDKILVEIRDRPAVFFLDPFGLKGIEWKHIYPVLNRPYITEILLRVKPGDISRLAGFSGVDRPGAAKKRQILTNLYGFTNSQEWEQIWDADRTDGLVELYIKTILDAMQQQRGKSFAFTYAIKTIEGRLKYCLVFATRHPKGAVLMSSIIYGRERCYERDVKEYKEQCLERQPVRQLSMLDIMNPPPTEEEIFANLVNSLKEEIYERFAGKTCSRIGIHETMLPKWFGIVSGSHLTQAFKELEEEGRITQRSGQRSKSSTTFVFAK